MAGQSIDAAFAAIVEDCQAIAVEAVKNAAKKTQDKVIGVANNFLMRYYERYQPKRYQRTKSLQKAIIPVFVDKSSSSKICFEVGVKYDASPLIGLYKSNSWYHQSGTHWISRDNENFDFDSQNNGIPQPDWILDNYLRGEHGGYYNDGFSSSAHMERFFNTTLDSFISTYVQDELFAAITSRL